MYAGCKEREKDHHIARFERLLNHSGEKVWAAVTENDKSEKWMPNLEVKGLEDSGS